MKQRTPKFPAWIIRRLCKDHLQESILGDLEEQFEEQCETKGLGLARLSYFWQSLKFIHPQTLKSFTGNQKLNSYGMIKNYLKVGLRNLLKYKTFSLINVVGLSVAMTIGLFVIQMLYTQSQYDQFHTKKDRIFRILSQQEPGLVPNAKCPVPLAFELKRDYSFVEEVVQMYEGVGGDAVNQSQNRNTELRGFFSGNEFFEIFDFSLALGDNRTALASPNSIVLTKEKSLLLFGTEDPIGKTVHFSDRNLDLLDFNMGLESAQQPVDWGVFTVTGVIDLSKYQTHLQFDALFSLKSLDRLQREGLLPDHSKNWRQYNGCFTYALLRNEQSKVDLQTTIDQIVTKEYVAFKSLEGLSLPIQKLSDITPGRLVGADMSIRLPVQAYYFLGFLAFIILFSASLNYTNLSIARSLTRAREIGIRKVNGASRKQVFTQFLCEALIVSFFALLVATLFLLILKPMLSQLWVSNILVFELIHHWKIYALFVLFTIVVGLSAGLYSSRIMSGFTPITALKGQSTNRKIGIKQVLNITQFAFSLIFIVTSILIFKQFKHYSEFEYQFNTSNIINVPIQGNDVQLLKTEFKTIVGVEEISACELLPSLPNIRTAAFHFPGKEEVFSAVYHSVDRNFIPNMGLEMIHGQNFSRSDASDEIIIDQTMAKKLGYDNEFEAVGQTIQSAQNEVFQIISVIKNFEFQTPINDNDGPVVFWNRPEQFNYLNIRISKERWEEVIPVLENEWRGIDQLHPFKAYLYDEQLTVANLWMSDLGSIIGFISILAIVISCLGLLGMAVYQTERRIKEIGVRKVLGGSTAHLTYLLSSSFIKMLFIAVLIGTPISYFINNLWLQNLPNRVDLDFGTLFIGALGLLLLGLLSISFQVVKVSHQNPVESLRDE